MGLSFTVEREPLPAPRITDFEGLLLLIHPHGKALFTHPDGNEVNAVKADVLVLDGEGEPELVRGLTVTQAVLVRSLACRLAEERQEPVVTLARLQYVPSRRDPARRVWVFGEPSATDVDLARLYVEEHGNPFGPETTTV